MAVNSIYMWYDMNGHNLIELIRFRVKIEHLSAMFINIFVFMLIFLISD